MTNSNALINAIAAKFNVTSDDIISIQTWSKVYFVRIKNIGCRFVSLKIEVVEEIIIEVKLAEMTCGSEKMINWANKIRANTLEKLIDPTLVNFCKSKNDASWWIANRSYGNTGRQYNLIFGQEVRHHYNNSVALAKIAKLELAIA